jgi:hypothetical protein
MEGLKVWYDRVGDILEAIFEDVFERRTTDGHTVGFM